MAWEDIWKQYQDQLGAAPTYNPNQSVIDAEKALKDRQANKPGDYTSALSPQIDALLKDIQSRKPFQYDFNADPLYQQYKDMYTQQGQKAARDVTGQMSALTGGYGNSYAATAGNQAYQGSLGQLNSIIPELQANAAGTYERQGQQMANNLSMLQSQESTAFGQYQAGMDDYYSSLQAATDAYKTAYSQDYGAYQDQMNKWQNDQQIALQLAQVDQQQANYDAEHAPKKGGGGGGGNKGGYTSSQYKRALYLYDEYGEDSARAYIKQLGLDAKQEEALMREAGVFSRQSSNGANAGHTPPIPQTAPKNQTPSIVPMLPLQQANMDKYLKILNGQYR